MKDLIICGYVNIGVIRNHIQIRENLSGYTVIILELEYDEQFMHGHQITEKWCMVSLRPQPKMP